MRIRTDSNRIPHDCIERFIPSMLLNHGIFNQMAVIHGGLSSLVTGFSAFRQAFRGYHIIGITLSGSGEYVMEDGQRIITRTNDLFFSHSDGQGHVHHPHSKEPWILIWMQISAENSWLVPPTQDWEVRRIRSAKRLRTYLEEIFSEELEGSLDAFDFQQLYAQLFFLALQRELQSPRDVRLIRYRQNFGKLWMTVSASLDKPWLLSDLCREVGLSSAHFSRLCRHFYGKSPGAKIRELKMEHAKAMLSSLDCPVYQVAEAVGYESTTTFSAAFSRYYGISPRQVRQQSIFEQKKHRGLASVQ